MIFILFIAIGVLTIVCAVRNCDWLIAPKGRRYAFVRAMSAHFGRNAVRIFYVCIGVFVIIIAILGIFQNV